MKHIFEPAALDDIRTRLQKLRMDSPRQWGRMTPAQMLAHCAGGLEQALGDRKPPRMMIGRVLGWAVKPLALGDDAPMKRNSPTVPELVIADERELDVERARVLALLDRVATQGRAACTSHPHSFFGPMTPDEWGVLMYKHLDHHLRQFAV